MKPLRAIYWMMTFAVTYLCSGCERNELCYDHTHADGSLWVGVDWSDLPEGVRLPDGVSITLYNGKQSTTYRDTYGGNIVSADGKHRLLVFNSDTEMIRFRNMDRFETAEAYLDVRSRTPYRNSPATKVPTPNSIYYGPGSAANEKTRSEVLVGQPDRVFATGTAEVEVSYNATRNNDTIRVRPRSRVMFVDLTVSVKGLYNVRECRGSLSGVSCAVMLGEDKVCEGTGTMVFELSKHGNTLTQNVTVFGVGRSPEQTPPEEQVQQILTLEFLLVDNTVKAYDFDVRDKIDFDELGPEIVIPIEVGVVDIPDVEPNGDGFDADISDWGPQVDIPIGIK